MSSSCTPWQEWTARLEAYVMWLNSQLRKESRSRRVCDLRSDLRDGVVIAQLIAVLSGETVPGLDLHPDAEATCDENVQRLFRFLRQKGMPLHSVTPKEVRAGDPKAAMRLVHAVASHYRPEAVMNTHPPQRCRRRGSSGDRGDCSRLSAAFVDQLLTDVRQAKRYLLLLHEALLEGRSGRSQSLGNVDPASEKTDVPEQLPSKGKSLLLEQNEKFVKTIEEKDQEIKRLKLALSTQAKYTVPSRVQKEELQVVSEALGSLRRCFPANDPRQHTLDTVDQSLAALLERVNALEMVSANHAQNDREMCSMTSMIKPQGSMSPSDEGGNCTKVVYYMDKSLTPFRCLLHKRIGEATLRDFKLVFDRPGQYRYHFKTLDSEFGMVKEEALHDEDVLPGWDGKIVAWIEEDCS